MLQSAILMKKTKNEEYQEALETKNVDKIIEIEGALPSLFEIDYALWCGIKCKEIVRRTTDVNLKMFELCAATATMNTNIAVQNKCSLEFGGNAIVNFDTLLKAVKQCIKDGANDWNRGLTHACYGGNLQVIQLMIDHGATSFDQGLICAFYTNKIDIAELMISFGAKMDVSKLISTYYKHHNVKMIQLLIKENDVNECVYDLSNIMSIAKSKEEKEEVRQLFETILKTLSSYVNDSDGHYYLLYAAVVAGDLKTFENYFYESDEVYNRVYELIKMAADGGHLEIFKRLLPKLNFNDSSDWTYLAEFIGQGNNCEILKHFVEYTKLNFDKFTFEGNPSVGIVLGDIYDTAIEFSQDEKMIDFIFIHSKTEIDHVPNIEKAFNYHIYQTQNLKMVKYCESKGAKNFQSSLADWPCVNYESNITKLDVIVYLLMKSDIFIYDDINHDDDSDDDGELRKVDDDIVRYALEAGVSIEKFVNISEYLTWKQKIDSFRSSVKKELSLFIPEIALLCAMYVTPIF